jgi:hypothetical protein
LNVNASDALLRTSSNASAPWSIRNSSDRHPGQRGDRDLNRLREEQADGTIDRCVAGGIGIEQQDDPVGEAPEDRDVLLGQRGA